MKRSVSSVASGAAIIAAGLALLADVVLGSQSVDLDQNVAAAEVQPALIVDLEYLDADDVADVDNIGHMLGTLDVELADVDQTLLAGSDLNERAEIHDAGDLAQIHCAGLGIGSDGLDDLDRSLALLSVQTCDEYLTDLALFLDVDLTIALRLDLLNDLAGLADDLGNLVRSDRGGEHLRSIGAELGTRLCDCLEHDLVEDVVAGFMCFLQRFLDHLGGQTADLQIHLDGGDAVVGTGNLEVHVAEEVLKTLDIDHGHPALAFGDQTAGDTGDRSLDRNARVHEGEGGAADRTLRGRTVRGYDLGHESEGIGELFHRGDDRQQRAFCECAVTDLTTTRSSGRTGLADRVAREVVVMHIALLSLVVDAVEQLHIADRTEGCDGQYLCLTSGEQT